MAFSREILLMASYQDREGGALEVMTAFAAPFAASAGLTLFPFAKAAENRLVAGRGKAAWESGLREEMVARFDALLCCESVAGAVGRGLASFAEAFRKAGKPVMVRRGDRLELVVEVRRTPEADWRASWAELKTENDVVAEVPF